MRKGRCVFDNFIRNTSALFAVLAASITLSGCGDVISDYMRENNLLDPVWNQTEENNSEGNVAAPVEIPNDSTVTSGEGDDSGTSKSGWNSDTSGETADENASGNLENYGMTDSDDGTDTSGDSATIDIDSVNQKIDDLISQIEQETGRTGRGTDVEESETENGSDATTYFSDTYQRNQRAELGLTDVDIIDLKASQQGNYAYEHLTEDGKTLYVELLTIIKNRAKDVVVSTLDEETLDVVCTFVQADHPEIFYMDGYTYTRYTIGGELKKLSFTGNYIYSAEEIEARQAKIDEYTIKCLAGAPTDGDDYSKVKYVYDYLITNTDYDSTAADNQNICSVFIYGKSVCQGYAKATQFLLQQLGVPATLVTGKVNGVGHAWNLVYADGEYTYVDTTWGDSSYQKQETGESSQKLPLINYTYLCCTTQDISKTHTIAETLPMPACTSMKNNYYVREGEYFTEADMDAVGELFSRRYSDGSNNVTIKCSTQSVYQELINKLINNQQVFGYMDGSNNTVSYTTFDEQYILIIWLY